MRAFLRRLRRRVEWYAAQPVRVTDLRFGEKILLRDGSVHRVVGVREVPFPVDVVHVAFVERYPTPGRHNSVAYSRFAHLRRAPLPAAVRRAKVAS